MCCPHAQMTSELKNELQLLRMRGAFDTKRFYRTSDYAKGLPKFFQVGTMIEDPLDPAGSGGRRRPKTMVREALNDPKLRRRAKARFKKVRTELACPRRFRVPSRACAPAIRRCRRRRALGARAPPSRGPASGNPSPRASERRGPCFLHTSCIGPPGVRLLCENRDCINSTICTAFQRAILYTSACYYCAARSESQTLTSSSYFGARRGGRAAAAGAGRRVSSTTVRLWLRPPRSRRPRLVTSMMSRRAAPWHRERRGAIASAARRRRSR